jgi:transposase
MSEMIPYLRVSTDRQGRSALGLDAQREVATEVGRRLLEVPGIGPVLASAFVASVADPAIFKSGRDLAAWIGLVPR